MQIIRIFIRLFLFVVVTLIGLRIIVLLLQRLPGLIVALSLLALFVLSFAWRKGSFRAVGLHSRHSITIALIVSGVLFILSTSILIFVK